MWSTLHSGKKQHQKPCVGSGRTHDASDSFLREVVGSVAELLFSLYSSRFISFLTFIPWWKGCCFFPLACIQFWFHWKREKIINTSITLLINNSNNNFYYSCFCWSFWFGDKLIFSVPHHSSFIYLYYYFKYGIFLTWWWKIIIVFEKGVAYAHQGGIYLLYNTE